MHIHPLIFKLLVCSGGQTPVTTSNTVEPLETSRLVEHIIPQKDLTYVYGENNSNLTEIRQV